MNPQHPSASASGSIDDRRTQGGNIMQPIRGKESAAAMLIVLFTLFLTAFSSAADYAIVWSTIDGGGGTSSGGDFTLSGTIGQPDAGTMAGGDFALMGGFWPGEYDCVVNMESFGMFAAEWLSGSGSPADLNEDGDVDIVDLATLASLWLSYCPGDWPL